MTGLLLLEAEALAETLPAFGVALDSPVAFDSRAALDSAVAFDSRVALDSPIASDSPVAFDPRVALGSPMAFESAIAFSSRGAIAPFGSLDSPSTEGSSIGGMATGSVELRPGLDALRQASGAIAGRPEPARPPGLAFLLSALVPGTGQLYNGNRRGYAYLGIEAAAWFTRMSYLDAGDRKERDFEAFARRHWSYERFHETIGGDGCLGTAETDSLIQYYEQNDPDQYYEELSKTDAFRCGWDDFDPTTPDGLSPRRADYREQRQEANDLKGRANLAVAVLVVNRVVSAVDAFRTARGRQSASNLRFESRLGGSFLQPRATIGIVKEIP